MVDGSYGQTAIRQLDGLADLGELFSATLWLRAMHQRRARRHCESSGAYLPLSLA